MARRQRSSRVQASQLYVEPRMSDRWDGAIIAITFASLLVVAVDALWAAGPIASLLLRWADNLACLVFVVDFGLRMRRASRRLEFLRRNWIDLLGSVPMVGAVRGVRLIRFVRLLRLTRLAAVWRRFARRHDVPLPSRALGSIVAVTVVMWLLSSVAFFELERGHNKSIRTFADAMWWSMTTLSTVGYGDLYPATTGGRVVAVFTMVLGIGVLGAVAATVASAFVEFKDRGRRGLRRYVVRDHLLVLGWNEKASSAIVNFLGDPRHEATDVVLVAPLDENPMDDPRVRFVRGSPGKLAALRRASAKNAGAAVVLAADPSDPRSDYENALVVSGRRRINSKVRIPVELVDSENHDHLKYAGCDAIIDRSITIANLLVRSVQDIGVSEVVAELLSSQRGSELYRVAVDEEMVGKSFRDYAVAMLDESVSVIGLVRGQKSLINPDPGLLIEAQDDAFVVSREPPR